MKKAIAAGAAALLVLLAAAGLYALEYPIRADNSNLVPYADQFLNRGLRDTGLSFLNDIRLYDTVLLGARKFTLAEINGQLGEIRLVRGLNGRYRIDSIGQGGGSVRSALLTDGEADCRVLLGGRNGLGLIAEAVCTVAGRPYRTDIPQADHFYLLLEVEPPSPLDSDHPLDVRFYDAEGTDITGILLGDPPAGR